MGVAPVAVACSVGAAGAVDSAGAGADWTVCFGLGCTGGASRLPNMIVT